MEAEIQRKKEQINFATNFEKARGFVRTNWKTYGYKIDEDPTQADSTDSDYDSEQEEQSGDDSEEEQDAVASMGSRKNKSPGSRSDSDFVADSEAEDDVAISLVNKDDAKIIKKIVRQRKP